MNEKRENQEKIIAAINNGFNLFFEPGQFILLDESFFPLDPIYYDNVENFAEIIQVTKEYIRNHRYEFRLGNNDSNENIHMNYEEAEGWENRPWWSPLITVDECRMGRVVSPPRVGNTRKIMKDNYYIHPGALTGAQYEELKQEILGACKVRGCCNNYMDPDCDEVRFTMVGNVCRFHYFFSNHQPPFFAGKYCEGVEPEGLIHSPQQTPSLSEVQQKNQELINKEDNLIISTEELLEIIDENEQIVQAGQSLGLSLPTIPADALEYFQAEFFTLLDETQPLDSLDNRKILATNEKILRKKINIKTNIYSLYNNNKKKLNESKNRLRTPKSELEKLKEEVINQINQFVNRKDNLSNIDLQTLVNGKYQNWEKDINQLANSDEVMAYRKEFLNALRTQGAKAKKTEQENRNNSNTTAPVLPQNSPEKGFQGVDQNFKTKLANLPLVTSKEVIKNKIRELFNKYKPDIQKISKVWQGEKNWMSRLEKCNSIEEAIAFLEVLEKSILQSRQTDQQGQPGQNKNRNWVFPLILSGVILVGLIVIILIAKRRAQRQKLNRGKIN